jgi:rhodanese-related sulfurtransferase
MTSAPTKDWELFATIGKDELFDTLRAGNVQIVNVLAKAGAKVIPSTRHIPLDELEDRVGELDRTWLVVVYCNNRDCPMARQAARLLVALGFHARPYEGGIEEWTAAGLPTEGPLARGDAP